MTKDKESIDFFDAEGNRIGTLDATAELSMYDAGIEACMSRLNEMHRIASGRHNYYGYAALELAKLKGEA